MVHELTPVDISNTPDVLRLAEEVQASGRPRVLRKGDESLAVLIPVSKAKRRPLAHVSRDAIAVAERTAGVFRQYAKHPPLTAEEERAAIERAIAEDATEREGA